MAGVNVERIVAVAVFVPLPQLVRHDQICTVLELRLLDQAGFLAVGVVGAAAVIAQHGIVVAAAVGHGGDHGLILHHIPRCVTAVHIDGLVGHIIHCDVLNAGDLRFGQDVVQTGIVSVGRVFVVAADCDPRTNQQIRRLCSGQREVVHALRAECCAVLIVVRGATLNRTGVTLTGIFQPDHAELPFQGAARCARILRTALPPELHALGVRCIVDRGKAGVSADFAVILHTGKIFGVGDIRIDLSGAVRTLRPLFIARRGVAAHLENAVAVLVALTGKGVLLKHPHQMVRATHHIVIVDVLAGVNGVAAVCVLLCRNFDAPELRQGGEIVHAGRGCRRRRAGQTNAVIGQLADCRIGRAEQRELHAMHTVVIQDCAEPAFQHPVVGAQSRVPVRRPPVDEQCVHLFLRGCLFRHHVVEAVDCIHIARCQYGGSAVTGGRQRGARHSVENLNQGFIRCHVSIHCSSSCPSLKVRYPSSS